MKIWCVEDDESIRDIEVYTLNSTDFEATGFSDAAAFRDAALSRCHDNGNPASVGTVFQKFQQFHAVLSGQHNIKDNQIRLIRGKRITKSRLADAIPQRWNIF